MDTRDISKEIKAKDKPRSGGISQGYFLMEKREVQDTFRGQETKVKSLEAFNGINVGGKGGGIQRFHLNRASTRMCLKGGGDSNKGGSSLILEKKSRREKKSGTFAKPNFERSHLLCLGLTRQP